MLLSELYTLDNLVTDRQWITERPVILSIVRALHSVNPVYMVRFRFAQQQQSRPIYRFVRPLYDLHGHPSPDRSLNAN